MRFHLPAWLLEQICSCPRVTGGVLTRFGFSDGVQAVPGGARQNQIPKSTDFHTQTSPEPPSRHPPGALLKEGFVFKPRADFATHPAEVGNGVPMATAAPGTTFLRDAADPAQPRPCPAPKHLLPSAKPNFSSQIKRDLEKNCCSWEERGGLSSSSGKWAKAAI